jgi:uncharacterized protein YkwD
MPLPTTCSSTRELACLRRMRHHDEMMNGKWIAGLMALSSTLIVGCASSNHGSAAPEAQDVAATPTEQALLASLNAERRKTGKTELTISPKLAGLARGESDAAAASGQIPGDTTAVLKARSGFGTVGKLQGALKDRGTQTGAGFVEYWSKGQRETLLDSWSKVGVGVSKSSDGRLFAVVVLGSIGGGGASLMQPAMSPGGF